MAATVYRSLLRTAKLFDSRPGWKALLFLPHVHGPEPSVERQAVSEVTSKLDSLRSAFTHAGPYQPQHGSLAAFVRSSFRAAQQEGDSSGLGMATALASQAELLRIAAVAQAFEGAAEWQLPTDLPELDGELQQTLSVENGTLLVEHPAASAPGGALTVVFDQDQHVQEADGDSDFVIRGLVVNRPFPVQVKEAFPSFDLGSLGDLPLWHGGAADDALYVLHRCPGVKNAVELVKNALWVGGNLEELTERLSSGEAMPEDFKVLMGCTIWAGQDTEAVADMLATHIPAAGSAVSSACLLPPIPLQGEYEAAIEAAAGAGGDEGFEHGKFWHQNATWASCLTLMGGEYADMGQGHPARAHILGGIMADPDSYAVASGTPGTPTSA